MLLRKKLAVLLAAAMMVVVMMATTVTPAFAGPKSENSCGKANPQFPAQSGEDLDRCGVDNNPNSPDKPEGQPFQD